MIFGEHAELALGVLVVGLYDQEGGHYRCGNADDGRQDARPKFPHVNPCVLGDPHMHRSLATALSHEYTRQKTGFWF
jgi:hypothetical protein